MSTPRASLTIEFDWTAFQNAISALARPKLDRAVALALVDTAKGANGKAASAIAKHTALRVGDVKPKLRYDYVKPGEFKTNLYSSVRRISMIHFNARQTGAGVRVRKPWGRTQVLQGAFIAKGRNANTHVFRRVKGAGRLPIERMLGPSIHGTYAQPSVQGIVTREVRARLPKMLARRIKAEMRRRT